MCQGLPRQIKQLKNVSLFPIQTRTLVPLDKPCQNETPYHGIIFEVNLSHILKRYSLLGSVFFFCHYYCLHYDISEVRTKFWSEHQRVLRSKQDLLIWVIHLLSALNMLKISELLKQSRIYLAVNCTHVILI